VVAEFIMVIEVAKFIMMIKEEVVKWQLRFLI
jgi:hypothetical protein